MTPAEREELARAIYEAATEGYYMPSWSRLTSDRRVRWLNAADAAWRKTSEMRRNGQRS